jgi:Ca2+-binding EF-hand superfamily protein
MRKLALALGGALCSFTVPVRAQQALPRPADPRVAFREADTNHDGVLDHEELSARVVQIFYLADKNKDGSLTIEELEAAGISPASAMKGDRNGDHKLTLTEFANERLQEFQDADKDKDGVLSLEEVLATYQQSASH